MRKRLLALPFEVACWLGFHRWGGVGFVPLRSGYYRACLRCGMPAYFDGD